MEDENRIRGTCFFCLLAKTPISPCLTCYPTPLFFCQLCGDVCPVTADMGLTGNFTTHSSVTVTCFVAFYYSHLPNHCSGLYSPGHVTACAVCPSPLEPSTCL